MSLLWKVAVDTTPSYAEHGDYVLEHHGEGEYDRYVNAMHKNGDPAGELVYDKSDGQIQMLSVEPEHQRKGLAKAMVGLAQQHHPDLHHGYLSTPEAHAFADRVPLKDRGGDL